MSKKIVAEATNRNELPIVYAKTPEKSNWATINELETLSVELDGLASVTAAVEDACLYSPNADERYHGALSLLANRSYGAAKKLERLIGELVKGGVRWKLAIS